MEEISARKKRSYQAHSAVKKNREKGGEEGRPELSQLSGQHERRQKTKVESEELELPSH